MPLTNSSPKLASMPSGIQAGDLLGDMKGSAFGIPGATIVLPLRPPPTETPVAPSTGNLYGFQGRRDWPTQGSLQTTHPDSCSGSIPTRGALEVWLMNQLGNHCVAPQTTDGDSSRSQHGKRVRLPGPEGLTNSSLRLTPNCASRFLFGRIKPEKVPGT
jgi:hypothetical protein